MRLDTNENHQCRYQDYCLQYNGEDRSKDEVDVWDLMEEMLVEFWLIF